MKCHSLVLTSKDIQDLIGLVRLNWVIDMRNVCEKPILDGDLTSTLINVIDAYDVSAVMFEPLHVWAVQAIKNRQVSVLMSDRVRNSFVDILSRPYAIDLVNASAEDNSFMDDVTAQVPRLLKLIQTASPMEVDTDTLKVSRVRESSPEDEELSPFPTPATNKKTYLN